MPDDNCRELSYIQAIQEALDQSMMQDVRVIVIGEGVPDPKAIFGSTNGLREKYGKDRIFDMPLSENGITGVCIGAAISGMRPVLIHQRVDFALLSLDQLINNAAKWHYMFNGKSNVPLVVRMIVGRGWGQGPQHSQSLQALFALFPGLKVVMPTTAYDAKGMMIAAINDNNPVIFIEHRWLHSLIDMVPSSFFSVPLDRARVVMEGCDVTVASFSYMTIEALKAASTLLAIIGVSIEIIDMRSIRPLDSKRVIDSVMKTGRLMVVDTASKTGSIAGELITQVVEAAFNFLKVGPVRICSPDFPVPTAASMTNGYYPTSLSIADAILKLIGKELNDADNEKLVASLSLKGPNDIPNHEFKGPF